ncbi:MAG: M28 family peptidase [Pseudonocardiaceae bacterium]|nr:M28 family peptidase [Pseudonocardiaceae bacterium]
MPAAKKSLRTGATGLLLSAGLVLTSAPATAAPPSLADQLANKVSADGVQRHLIALQRIAETNGGNRSANTGGYDASIDYIAGKLTNAGFEVSTPTFDATKFVVESESLEVDGQPVDVRTMSFSPSTEADGVTGPLAVLPEDDTPGCGPDDFQGADYTGTVALIRRGACTFAEKQQYAADAGAIAAVVSNNEPGELSGTLGEPGAGSIPTGGVTQEDGDALTGKAGASVTFETVNHVEEFVERNLVAQTRTGRADNVVTAGAHLDSVDEGPGINDNGSGSAALLETALRMGGSPKVTNAVRFAWWGAEEQGLQGSTAYVRSLSFEQQLDIALYLNFDMVGSPNAGYFAYDGDGSDFGEPGPQGSAHIEKSFVDYFDSTGVRIEGTELSGRSDYAEFVNVGIPAGGLFTGAEGVKTEEQAREWGGEAGAAYDPCYHTACDNLANIDRQALDRNVKGIAHVTASYGESTEGVNGVPSRQQRKELRAASTRSAAPEGHSEAVR